MLTRGIRIKRIEKYEIYGEAWNFNGYEEKETLAGISFSPAMRSLQAPIAAVNSALLVPYPFPFSWAYFEFSQESVFSWWDVVNLERSFFVKIK